jgi:hypothetical protein
VYRLMQTKKRKAPVSPGRVCRARRTRRAASRVWSDRRS